MIAVLRDERERPKHIPASSFEAVEQKFQPARKIRVSSPNKRIVPLNTCSRESSVSRPGLLAAVGPFDAKHEDEITDLTSGVTQPNWAL